MERGSIILMKNQKYIKFSDLHDDIHSSLSSWQTNSSQYYNVLCQFREEANHVEGLLQRTLTMGESNSLLIIGSRGCGKTSMLNAVLNKLEEEKLMELGIIVRLSGLLQTDDRLALKEITKQLLNVVVDEGEVCKFGSFAENLSFLLKTLNGGSRESSMPIIFILDEFDLFTHHKNQTLLYNLFDIAQSAQAPICVVGLTCRLDVIELLEKRVKSRFSHRQIYLFPHDSFEHYMTTAKSLLKVDPLKFKQKDIGTAWNLSIDEFFKGSEVSSLLKRQFCFTREIRSLKSYLLIAVSKLNESNPWIKIEHLKESSKFLGEDSKVNVLQGLSILQLSLMIAMKHISKIYDGEPFNFEMVYHQYCKYGEKQSSMSSFERPVVFKAFDQLQCLELIQPVDQNRSSVQREYRLMNMMVLPTQIEEAIARTPNIPTFLSHWCASNVI